MTAVFARLTAGFLALTLLLTAETMALARGAPTAVGEMILCTSAGVVAVPVDAEGNPTEPAHLCPDCLLFFAVFQGDGPEALHLVSWGAADLSPVVQWSGAGGAEVRPFARAPPASV